MKLKISKHNTAQILLIYLMLLSNQSIIYESTLKNFAVILVGLVGGYLFFRYREKIVKDYGVLLASFLFAVSMFVRLLVGGVGILAWADWCLKIFLVVAAVRIDPERFLTNYLKLVYVLAICSIVGFLMDLIDPNLWGLITPFSTMSVMGNKLHGMFLYVTGDLDRNRGLFTEQGVYQIVLNTAIFICAFFRNKLFVTDKYFKQAVFIIVIAILTCQSTTGYIGLFSILLFLSFKNDLKRTRNRVRVIIVLVIFIGLIEYGINGENGLIGSKILGKLIDLDWSGKHETASTGYWRILLWYTCVEVISQHPFGIGFDRFNAIIEGAGGAGMSLMQFIAAMGLIPGLIVVFWYFYPLKKDRRISLPCSCSYIFLYLNTMLAQTSPFYPALIMMPIYLMERNKGCDKR